MWYLHTYICVCVYVCVYIYIYNGILFSHEKERNLAIYDNMVGTWGHYAKWNKSDRERQILYVLTYMWNLKTPNSEAQTVEWWLPGVGVGGKWGDIGHGYKLDILRWTGSGDLLYNMVITANNTIHSQPPISTVLHPSIQPTPHQKY